MMNKFVLVAVLMPVILAPLSADPTSTVGSIWSHAGGATTVSTAPTVSLCSDPLAHSVGDLVTIVVDLQNTITKDQNTTTAKTTAVNAVINALLYPNDGTSRGYNFYNYHGQSPTTSWNSAQTFNGGGSIANDEAASTTIQARVIGVAANGVLRIEATRLSRAGEEDTSMVLTGLVRPDDLSTANSISSSRIADLEIVQKGKGTLTNDQRKGWLTKFYEFIEPF
jgi:flagellar L-ring protein precursor FlgH